MTFLMTCTIQATIILLIALCGLPLLRGKSAALRHCVISTALVFASLTPIFNLVMPVWNVSSFVTQHPAVAPIREQISAMTLPATRILTADSSPDTGTAAASTPSQSSELAGRLPWIVWTAGVLIGGIVLITGLARLARIALASRPVANGQWERVAGSISSEYGLKRSVELLESRNPSILVTWGFFHPKVILPAGAREWPEERTRIVLRHELAHISRADWIVQMIAQTFRIVYWFNPLVWIVCRRLRLESECACDDAALSRDIEGHEYAGHLLDLARILNKPDRTWSAALTMARPSTIERRFSAMLNPALNRHPVTRLALLASVLAGLCITLPLSIAGSAATVRPATANPAPAVSERTEANANVQPELAPASPEPIVAAPVKPAAPATSKPAEPAQNRLPAPRQERVGALERALQEVAGDGDISDIEELLRAGANVNAVIIGDGTPLMAAAGEGHVEAVRLLLDRGADPNIAVPGDGNALIAAASEGHADVVRLLLDRGANPDAAVPGDGNALIAAASEGHINVVALLLDRGANIDMVVPGDENALIQASGEGHLQVVMLLVNRRADVNARVWVEPSRGQQDGGWRTPLSEARREGHQDIVQFLLSAGARE